MADGNTRDATCKLSTHVCWCLASLLWCPVGLNGLRKHSDVVGRTLRGPSFTDPEMTNEMCTSFCATRGYSYAGTEWFQECCKIGSALFPQGSICSDRRRLRERLVHGWHRGQRARLQHALCRRWYAAMRWWKPPDPLPHHRSQRPRRQPRRRRLGIDGLLQVGSLTSAPSS